LGFLSEEKELVDFVPKVGECMAIIPLCCKEMHTHSAVLLFKLKRIFFNEGKKDIQGNERSL
jgi:hypothetical protein